MNDEALKGSVTACTICKQVMPKKVITPLAPVITTMFKYWAFECGQCGREVARFSILPRVRCPYCRTVNNMRRLYNDVGY